VDQQRGPGGKNLTASRLQGLVASGAAIRVHADLLEELAIPVDPLEDSAASKSFGEVTNCAVKDVNRVREHQAPQWIAPLE
jgi:hypothetical protein